jgi:hypothetical protein
MLHSPKPSRELRAARDLWLSQWPAALEAWSRFVKLSEPRWLLNAQDLKREGMSGSFAAIRLFDHAVLIDLPLVLEQNLEGFGREILAHEIGHHVLAPGDIHDSARLLARIRRGLPTQESFAPQISNLYTDLLINDRLQRGCNIDILRVWLHLVARDSSEPTRLWTLYMRIYEILWSLPSNTLARGEISRELDIDADLGARLIRSYAADWMRGGGRFAMLCLPYLIEDVEKAREQIPKSVGRIWLDTLGAGRGGAPDGLVEIDADEVEGAIHPAEDPVLSGVARQGEGASTSDAPGEASKNAASSGQCREPFEFGEILRASGVEMSEHDIAVRYYRERARPHLIRFPQKETPRSSEPLIESHEKWELGEPLEDIDWLASLGQSPHIIPGLTTVQTFYGEQPGSEAQREPVDLDLYVDCSGSMPNPQQQTSFTALAGAIIVLSALRAGSRVQATLWSGKNQFHTTQGFTRDEKALLGILTGYIGGATAFPIHLLRDTFEGRKPGERAAHILILSDDGVTTLFDADEKGNSGWDVSRMALDKARAGGTMALNLWVEVGNIEALVRAREQGWRLHRVSEWAELIAFARAFARENYETGPQVLAARGAR